MQVFALFCRRAWNRDLSVAALAHILFGDKGEMVIATLGQVTAETNGDQQQLKDERAKTPLVSSWPVEWEPDLIELQTQLAAHALQ